MAYSGRRFSLLGILVSLASLFGVLLRIAFPPDPLHLDAPLDWRMSLSRMVAPFIAFTARAKLHANFLGGRFKLLPSPLLAV